MTKRILNIFFALTGALALLMMTAFAKGVYDDMKNPPYFIQTPTQKVRLYLEKADTPEKQTLGLMHRKKMAFNKGMIFPFFSAPRPAYMWMKNTYIPLDMLFFDKDFTICHIHLNARPFDETIIETPMPVNGVIEVNAGFVEKHHISIGDKIILPPQ